MGRGIIFGNLGRQKKGFKVRREIFGEKRRTSLGVFSLGKAWEFLPIILGDSRKNGLNFGDKVLVFFGLGLPS